MVDVESFSPAVPTICGDIAWQEILRLSKVGHDIAGCCYTFLLLPSFIYIILALRERKSKLFLCAISI